MLRLSAAAGPAAAAAAADVVDHHFHHPTTMAAATAATAATTTTSLTLTTGENTPDAQSTTIISAPAISSSATDSSSAAEETGFPKTLVNTEPDEATAVESIATLSTDSPVEETSVRDALQSWAVQSHIPLVHLTSLLKIIRRLSPDLPSDARTLLGVPGNSVTLTAMGSGELKNKDPVAVLKDGNGVEITENSEKAEHLGQYFASVFTRETEFRSRSANNAVETADRVLDSILFPIAVVERELKNLKEAKSSGPDNIPAKFLKELANELSKPLAHIFRSSFELGRLPSEWKTANIFPIYKGGARTNANNYRPVSLTCICCKIMEAIVKKATMEFMEQGHLISDLQHGFRQNRSCLSSLLLSTEQWTRALDEDGRVDVMYTDFKKAFDSVPHKRLIYKLSEMGIRGTLLTWITDFLTGRSQTVCIEASRSTPTPVLGGVPQGSVLGPLLFLVYINDCVDDLGCSAIMFADDVKLWRSIRSAADRYALQDSLNRLNSWSARWLLNFNVDKCVVLRLRTRRTSKEDDSFQYVLGGQPLSNVVEQKDLGFLMTSSLKPSSQCQRAAKSAIRVLFALRRGFVQIDKELFGKTYGAFVRSHLEYAVQAWRPWLKKDYQRLERVQTMATKMVKNLHHLPYETRLTELNLFPLNYRQLRGDLIQTYRIVRSRECALDFDEFFEMARTERLRGHLFKLQRKRAHSDVRQNAFSHRVIGAWNGRPDAVVLSESAKSFKFRLDAHLLRTYCNIIMIDLAAAVCA
nr:unnamed protein product [Spirometra erinaceieuropaei]